MKCRIAPALVTPVPGKFILKPHFRCDTLSPADKSAAPCCCRVCCLHSLTDFNGGNNPQNRPFSRGTRVRIPQGTRVPWPTRVHNSISIGSSVFAGFAVVTNTDTDSARYIRSKRLHLCTMCMRYGGTHWRQPRRGCRRHIPPIFWLGGRQREYAPQYYYVLLTFGYSRPILVALRSLSFKPISFGYKTPPIRFSQAGGQSAHKARPPQP